MSAIQHREDYVYKKYRVGQVKLDGGTIGSTIDKNRLLLASQKTIEEYEDLTIYAREMGKQLYPGDIYGNKATPFNDLARGSGAVRYTKHKKARWKRFGRPDDRATIMEDFTGTETPGLNKFPFQLKISTDTYVPGDKMWVLSVPDKSLVLKCVSLPQASGGGYVQKWEWVHDNPDDWIDPKYLANNTYIMKAPSDFGEATKGAGSLQFAAASLYAVFETDLMESRWQFEMTDEAWFSSHFLKFDWKYEGESDDTYKGGMFVNALETRSLKAIDYEVELWDVYGVSSKTLIDSTSGKVSTTSPGLIEYFSAGSRPVYNPEVDEFDVIPAKMKVAWIHRLERNKQEVTFFGGRGFMDWASTSIAAMYGNDAIQGEFAFPLGKAKSYHNSKEVKGYSYPTYQFTRYNIPGWGIINIAYWQMFDDPHINLQKAHDGLLPETSYNAFAHDIGFGGVNVTKIIRENSTYSKYKCGTMTPLGKDSDAFPVVLDGNYFHWIHEQTSGVQIDDVNKTMWLRTVYAQ